MGLLQDSHDEFRWLLQIDIFDDVMIWLNIGTCKSLGGEIRSEYDNGSADCALGAFEREILISKNSAFPANIYANEDFSVL